MEEKLQRLAIFIKNQWRWWELLHQIGPTKHILFDWLIDWLSMCYVLFETHGLASGPTMLVADPLASAQIKSCVRNWYLNMKLWKSTKNPIVFEFRTEWKQSQNTHYVWFGTIFCEIFIIKKIEKPYALGYRFCVAFAAAAKWLKIYGIPNRNIHMYHLRTVDTKQKKSYTKYLQISFKHRENNFFQNPRIILHRIKKELTYHCHPQKKVPTKRHFGDSLRNYTNCKKTNEIMLAYEIPKS